jgi:hypothetical protein
MGEDLTLDDPFVLEYLPEFYAQPRAVRWPVYIDESGRHGAGSPMHPLEPIRPHTRYIIRVTPRNPR